MAGPDIISVSSCGEAQRVLKRVEREASYRYQTLTLPEDGAAHCLYFNGVLIHRSRAEAPKTDAVSPQIGYLTSYPVTNILFSRFSQLKLTTAGFQSLYLSFADQSNNAPCLLW